MPTITGELEISTEAAQGCTDLATFSCGDGRLPGAEEDVEGLIEDIREGEWSDAVVLRVTRETPSGALVGVVALEPEKGPLVEHSAVPAVENSDAAFIIVLALSEEYRGRYTDKQGTPVSEVLLTDALRYLITEGDAPPPVQALIAPVNEPSKQLCGRLGFVDTKATIGASLYIRPRGLPVEVEAKEEVEDEKDQPKQQRDT